MSTIVLYHTNDTHARVSTIDDNDLAIGIDKISKIVNLSTLKNKNTFWFNAGDFLHGTPRINISNGENIVNLLNPTHLNAMVVGNHDINYGIERLCELSKEINAYILSANMVYKDTKTPVLLPYVVYDVDVDANDSINSNADSNDSTNENIKMGVFGLTTPEAAYKTSPKNVKDIEFENPIEVAKKLIKTLSTTCDVIIAITHLGLDNSSEFTSKKLAEEVEGIDLIIDGHSHTELPEGLKINNTLIVQTGAHDHNLGKVIVDVENKHIVSIKATLLNETDVNSIIHEQSDNFILTKLEEIDTKIDQLLNKPIVSNKHRLSGERALIRTRETELGNFTADACQYVTKADISVVNGGDIRTDLPEGMLTYKEILAVYPFKNAIQTYKVTGKTIKEILEHSVEFSPAAFGGFLHISKNVKFTYDINAEPRHRVKQVLINNTPLNMTDTYVLSISEFMAIGGDDYPIFNPDTLIKTFESTESMVIKYLTTADIDENDYALGRITVLS